MSGTELTVEKLQESATVALADPKKALAAVVAANPKLNAGGMTRGKETDEDFIAYRNALLREVLEFEAAVRWCAANMVPTKRIVRESKTQYLTSYGQKHTMEEATGIYVTNGTYIAAMLALGFAATDDYNPYFAAKMVKTVAAR